MSAVARVPIIALLWRLWRDPTAWARMVDIFVILIALSLPWSTSLVAIFATAFLVTMAPLLNVKALLRSLKRPVCGLPLVLFGLAVVGTLWSDAAWGARFYAIGPTAKLLVLPLLFYHFERSERGLWVFVAFLVSCTLLMMMSWIVAFVPAVSLKPKALAEHGVFVKNYIDQSQEFVLCSVALACPVVDLVGKKKYLLAALLAATALSFIVNMTFVTVSRTALVTMPIMLAVFAFIHLKWRDIAIALCAAAVLVIAAWAASPQLQTKMATFFSDYTQYQKSNEATSIGLRLEYWRKSLQFFAEAPVIGHGTGSTRGLFEKAATGRDDATGSVIGNPHNQTLYVAVQWGVAGVIVLYAMWFVHLLLFRGGSLAAWIGLLVVAQNILSSLFNSHLFDFHEGWMYVLGVGVAGGMTIRTKFSEAAKGPASHATTECWHVDAR